MRHQGRRFAVSDVAHVEALTERLTGQDRTLCTGFRLAGYLFLNDSTGANGSPTYAVLKEPSRAGEPHVELEGITLSRADEQARALLFEIVSGLYDGGGVVLPALRIEESAAHRCCPLCAREP